MLMPVWGDIWKNNSNVTENKVRSLTGAPLRCSGSVLFILWGAKQRHCLQADVKGTWGCAAHSWQHFPWHPAIKGGWRDPEVSSRVFHHREVFPPLRVCAAPPQPTEGQGCAGWGEARPLTGTHSICLRSVLLPSKRPCLERAALWSLWEDLTLMQAPAISKPQVRKANATASWWTPLAGTAAVGSAVFLRCGETSAKSSVLNARGSSKSEQWSKVSTSAGAGPQDGWSSAKQWEDLECLLQSNRFIQFKCAAEKSGEPLEHFWLYIVFSVKWNKKETLNSKMRSS